MNLIQPLYLSLSKRCPEPVEGAHLGDFSKSLVGVRVEYILSPTLREEGMMLDRETMQFLIPLF